MRNVIGPYANFANHLMQPLFFKENGSLVIVNDVRYREMMQQHLLPQLLQQDGTASHRPYFCRKKEVSLKNLQFLAENKNKVNILMKVYFMANRITD